MRLIQIRGKGSKKHNFHPSKCQAQYPYNNAMVVTLNIAHYNVHRVLIDNESFANI